MNGGSKNIDNVVRNEPQAQEKPAKEPVVQAEDKQDTGTGDRVLLAWSGQSFDYKEKGVKWYLILSLVVLAFIGYLVWQKDWFTIAITVVVTGILIWYIKTARPSSQEYSLSTFGITVSGHYYPYSEIHSFWMVYNQDVQKLFFVQTKKYMPSIVIDLSTVGPERVRTILSRKVPEQEGRGENILDKMIRLLGL